MHFLDSTEHRNHGGCPGCITRVPEGWTDRGVLTDRAGLESGSRRLGIRRGGVIAIQQGKSACGKSLAGSAVHHEVNRWSLQRNEVGRIWPFAGYPGFQERVQLELLHVGI